MKRKRIPGTGRLKAQSPSIAPTAIQQVYGVNYWETYAPVVQWDECACLYVSPLSKNYIPALSISSWHILQADLDIDMFMELPIVDLPPQFDRRQYVLQLHKIYTVSSRAGHNWHVKLKTGLLDLGFKPC
jgi:hypothetical protein